MNDSPYHSTTPPANTLHLPALLAAGFAALAGAIAWGVLAWLSGYEVGYVAWGIGLMVGFAATKCGGRGVTMATIAAALTIVAIFIGKFMGTQLSIENELEAVREEQFSTELFEELKSDAVVWSSMQPSPSDEEVRRFMLEREYGGFVGSGEVLPQEFQNFQASSIPMLEKLTVEQPSFEEWQERVFSDYRTEVMADLSPASLVIENLNPIDLLFAFLAVSTAYGMVKRAPASVKKHDEGDHDENGGDQQPPVTQDFQQVA